MKWSWKLFSALGIGVYVHATFVLLLLFVVLGSIWQGATVVAGLLNALLIVAVFFCVLVHEFSHALTARRYGIGTRDIILLPIGGVARLERIPSDPRQ